MLKTNTARVVSTDFDRSGRTSRERWRPNLRPLHSHDTQQPTTPQAGRPGFGISL